MDRAYLKDLDRRYAEARTPAARQKIERMIEREMEKACGKASGSDMVEVMATLRGWQR